MFIDVNFEYRQMVIPPRCRTARRQDFKAQSSIFVNEIPAALAPVALRVTNINGDSPLVKEYRWWKNRLWVPVISNETEAQVQLSDSQRVLAETFSGNFYEEALSECEASLAEHANGLLFIGGLLWEEAPEPYYTCSFHWSMRSNWSSIDVNLNWGEDSRRNLKDSYSARDWDIVRDRLAKHGGEDEVDGYRKMVAPIEILIPEAIRIPRRSECSHKIINWDGLEKTQVSANFEASVFVISGSCSECGGTVQQQYVPFLGVALADDDEE